MAWTRFAGRFGCPLLAVVFGAPLWVGCGDRSRDAEARAEKAGREAGAAARDAARAAGDAAEEARRNVEAFLRGFREETDKLDRSRHDLEARSRELKGEAKAEAERRIADLDRRQKELSRQAEDLKTAAADKVETLRARINDELEKLKRAYEAAAEEMRK